MSSTEAKTTKIEWTPARVVVAIVGAASFLYTLTQLYDWYAGEKAPSIVAAGEIHSFEVSPETVSAVEKLDKSIALQLSRDFYITLAIRNDGPLPAADVRIRTNADGYVELEWDDDKVERREFHNDISLGKLPAGKSLNAKIWADYSASLSRREPLMIYHDSGYGQVAIVNSSRGYSERSLIALGFFILFLAWSIFRTVQLNLQHNKWHAEHMAKMETSHKEFLQSHDQQMLEFNTRQLHRSKELEIMRAKKIDELKAIDVSVESLTPPDEPDEPKPA